MRVGNGIKVTLALCAAGAVTFCAGKATADTAYVANEATGTISVIDTTTNTIITTIGLGSDPAIPGTDRKSVV